MASRVSAPIQTFQKYPLEGPAFSPAEPSEASRGADPKDPQLPTLPEDPSPTNVGLARFFALAPFDVVEPCLSRLDFSSLQTILNVPALRESLDAKPDTKVGRPCTHSFQSALQSACLAVYRNDDAENSLGEGQAPHPSQESFFLNTKPHQVLLRKAAAQRMLEQHAQKLWQTKLEFYKESEGQPGLCNTQDLALGRAMELLADAEPYRDYSGRQPQWPQMPNALPIPDRDGHAATRAWQERAAEAMLFLNLAGPRHRDHFLGQAATGAALLFLGQEDRGVRFLKEAWDVGCSTAFGTMALQDNPYAFALEGSACRWYKAHYDISDSPPLAKFMLETALRSGSLQAFEFVVSEETMLPRTGIRYLVGAKHAAKAIGSGHAALLPQLLGYGIGSIDLKAWHELHEAAQDQRTRAAQNLYVSAEGRTALRSAESCLISVLRVWPAAHAISMQFELTSALTQAGLSFNDASDVFDSLLAMTLNPSEPKQKLECNGVPLNAQQMRVARRFVHKVSESVRPSA